MAIAPSAAPTLPADAGGLPLVVEAGDRAVPAVALTFDSNMTASMLRSLDAGRVTSYDNTAVPDQLDKEQAPATFFLSGLWVQRYPQSTRRLAADPLFEVGSHSYAHEAFAKPCYGLPSLPGAAMAADVQHSFDVLRQIAPGGRLVPYFRFPGGCYDDAARRALAQTGATLIEYDLPSGDAFATSADTVVRNVLTKARNGSVIVMHITLANAPVTTAALPHIIDGLRARGFRLVRLSDLIASGNLSFAATPPDRNQAQPQY